MKIRVHLPLDPGLDVVYGTAREYDPDAGLKRGTVHADDAKLTRRSDGEYEVKGGKGAVRLSAAVARRLGGTTDPAHKDPLLYVSVLSAKPIPAETFIELLEPYVPGLAIEETEDDDEEDLGDWNLAGPAIQIERWPAAYNVPTNWPAARRLGTVDEYLLITGLAMSDAPAELAHTLGEAALVIVAATDALCLDPYGLPLRGPGDLS